MQGHGSSITTFPENMSFDHGSTSSEAGMDSQIHWNSITTSTHSQHPEYRIPTNRTHIQFVHPVNHESLNAELSLGEPSSVDAQPQDENDERKRENAWTIRSRASLTLDGPQYEPSDILSSDNISQVHKDVDACQIAEHPNTYVSVGNSSDSASESAEDGLGHSLDVPRMSCKRKSLEVHVGQSPGAGSSNYFQHAERSMTENGPVTSNGPEQANPRLMLGVGGALSASSFSALSGVTPESSRRNFRLRINGSRHQDHHHGPANLTLPDPVNANVLSSSAIPSGLGLRNRLLGLNPPPSAENGSLSHIPFVHRNFHSRWAGPSSSREPVLHEEPTRNILRSISEHPMFVPASEIGSLPQQPTNFDLAAGNNITNNNIAGNIGSTSRAGSTSGLNPSEPSWPNRSRPQYSRRLSEIVRRSLLSTSGIESSGGQSSGPSGQAVRLGSASGSSNNGRNLSGSGSGSTLSERRHVDGAFGLPYSMPSLAGGGGGEGRTSMMSEIRHVLDLMRRGEGLRFEDMMMLDHSVLFGMANIHDRHREMRLDVDNMSYEELLALEDRIGNVCTGLTEETITGSLKQHTYINGGTEYMAETEPCSICREEYSDGEDLGSLQCGHHFHRDCIKQWLMQKNLCPICKTMGLTT